MPIVLSHFQIAPLLDAHQQNEPTCTVSPDLGLSVVTAQIGAEGAIFPGGERLAWADAVSISDNPNACYTLDDDGPAKIQAFSDVTDRYCSLMPTSPQTPPTLLLAGFPMHRIKDTDPHRDTLTKIRAVAPVVGPVLDTTSGLGYTAIQAAQTADSVITIELDPAVVAVARLNPWSRGLFENARIRQIVGDSFEVITEFEDGAFSRILHDPPTFALAGDLYSGEFYRELHRVLRRGGRLFHYIGDLQSAHGQRISRGVVRRLQEAGFQQVRPYPAAFGVTAQR